MTQKFSYSNRNYPKQSNTSWKYAFVVDVWAAKLAQNLIPEPTARSAVPGVSPGRGLLIVHKRSSKSMFMGDGDEIFLVCHDVMLTLISTIWRTIMNG